MLHHGRQARPDDKCQDPFPLKAAEWGLFLLILFASEDFHTIFRCRNTPSNEDHPF